MADMLIAPLVAPLVEAVLPNIESFFTHAFNIKTKSATQTGAIIGMSGTQVNSLFTNLGQGLLTGLVATVSHLTNVPITLPAAGTPVSSTATTLETLAGDALSVAAPSIEGLISNFFTVNPTTASDIDELLNQKPGTAAAIGSSLGSAVITGISALLLHLTTPTATTATVATKAAAKPVVAPVALPTQTPVAGPIAVVPDPADPFDDVTNDANPNIAA